MRLLLLSLALLCVGLRPACARLLPPRDDAGARALAMRALTALGTPEQRARMRQGYEAGRVEMLKPVPNTYRYERWFRDSLEKERWDYGGTPFEQMVDLHAGTGWQQNDGLVTDVPPRTVRQERWRRVVGPRVLDMLWLPGTQVADGGMAALPDGERARKIVVRSWFAPPTRFFFHPATAELRAFTEQDPEDPRGAEQTVVLREPLVTPSIGRSWKRMEIYVEQELYTRVSRESVDFDTPVPDAVFQRPANADLFAPESVLPATIPITFSHGYLLARVKAGEKADATFLLDTGAAPTVLTKALADRLGIKPGAAFTSYSGLGNFGTRAGVLSALAVGTAVRRDLPVDIVQDDSLETVGRIIGCKVEGIIGNSFLHAFLPTIDYEKKQLTLQRPDAPPPPGVSLPLLMDRGTPAAEVQIAGGKPLVMAFDTCAPITWLPPRYAAALPSSQVLWRWGMAVISLPRIAAGDAELRDVTARSSAVPPGQAPTGELLLDEDQGLYGSDLLRHFRFSLDYRRQRLALEPLAKPARGAGDWVGVGLWWRKQGRRVSISHVQPFSPADRAGVQPGDELLRIAGRAAAGVSEDEMRLLCWYGEEGTELPMVLRRQDRSRTLLLRRERLLQ